MKLMMEEMDEVEVQGWDQAEDNLDKGNERIELEELEA